MAKINNKVVRVGRKYVEIYTKDTKLNIEVTYNEFGNISFLLDSLSKEELKYKI